MDKNAAIQMRLDATCVHDTTAMAKTSILSTTIVPSQPIHRLQTIYGTSPVHMTHIANTELSTSASDVKGSSAAPTIAVIDSTQTHQASAKHEHNNHTTITTI
jgi:hypothetical protein